MARGRDRQRLRRFGMFAVVVSLAVALIGFLWWDGRTRTLTIYSTTLPVLVQHEHHDLDSVSDLGHGERVSTDGGEYVLASDAWVTGMSWEVENAPSSVIHHIVFARADKPQVICTNGAGTHEELLTIGSDTPTNSVYFPDGYAVFLPKGTPLTINAMLHNAEPPFGPGGTYDNVRIKLTLQLGSPLHHYRQLHMVRISLDDPACQTRSGTFDIPAHQSAYVQRVVTPMSHYTFPANATVVVIGVHTHGWDGGRTVTLFVNDKPYASFDPYRADAHPWSWKTPWGYPKDLELHAGDTVSLSAVYVNPFDKPLIDEAMGMISLWYADN